MFTFYVTIMMELNNKTTCAKCLKTIESRHYLICCLCNNAFDLDCTNVSESRFFNIMSKETKEKWMCGGCLNNKSHILNDKDSSIASFSNVTIRKKPTIDKFLISSFNLSSHDLDSSSSSGSSQSSKLNRSCPEMGEDLHDKLNVMNKKLNFLEEQLKCSELEIENLLSENHDLKNQLACCASKIDTLTNICKSDAKKTLSKSQKKNKLRETLSSTRRDSSYRDIVVSNIFHSEQRTVTELVSEQATCLENVLIDKDDQGETIPLSPVVTVSPRSVTKLVLDQGNESVRDNHDESPSPPTDVAMGNVPPQQESDSGRASPPKNFVSGHSTPRKNRICMLSSHKFNKLTKIAQSSLDDQFDICHYYYPGAGIAALLDNIASKLGTFTKKDYCIIFIGEEDFLKTENYANLVFLIRNCLLPLSHTNVILCCPTFKVGYYYNFFNLRVEIFNQILYNDNSIYQYVYLLDSNRNLVYDFTMFNRWSGCVNMMGMRNVFLDVVRFMSGIEEEICLLSATVLKDDNVHSASELFLE